MIATATIAAIGNGTAFKKGRGFAAWLGAHLLEPSGWTSTQSSDAKSIMDYVFHWLELRFLSGTQLTLFSGANNGGKVPDQANKVVPISSQAISAW